MKKIVALFLSVTMMLGTATALCSCKKGDTTPTTAASAESKPSDSVTTAKPTTSSVTTSQPLESKPDADGCLIEIESEWHYKVFAAPYNSTGPNGSYPEDTDEFAAFLRDHNWEPGALTLPEGIIDEMKDWQVAAAPFGDCDAGYDNSDIGWSDDNHGLIVYTTFVIEDLAEFRKNFNSLEIYTWFDNTPSFYLNGKLFFHKDTGLTGNPGDWVDGITYFDFDSPKFSDYVPEGITSYADLIDLLVEGENTFVATLKDAWGGRMFCLELAGCME